MTRKKYIKNTMILFVSMAVTKIVGALFKIPLANILGGTGMGYFSTAYGLYSPVFALTAAGIPTVLMRVTAQNLACNRSRNALSVRKTAIIFFSFIGFIGMAAVEIFAQPFAEHIACSPESTLAVRMIAPAVFICSIASVIRGYYEGMSEVMPSAEAAVAESVSRAVFGLALSYGVLIYARNRFESGLDVFGTNAVTYEQAHNAALPFAAAGAILAVTISEICGLLALMVTDKKRRKKMPVLNDGIPLDGKKDTVIRLLREILPIAASALVMNCVSFVDLLTVTRTINGSIAENTEFFASEFSAVLPYCGGKEGLANFLYGSYTGIAMSLYMIIPSFAGMTEKTSVPEIASAWERGDYKDVSRKAETLFSASSLIGYPACFGAAVLAEPIMSMLYKTRQAEVSVCVQPFTIICIGGLFMITASSMFGLFQAIGKAYIPLLLMSVSVIVKLALNPILLSIPELNISGAALSSALGYLLMCLLGAAAVKKCVPEKIHILRAVFPSALGGVLCALAALTVYNIGDGLWNNMLITIISVFSGAIIYGISLIICRFFIKSV